MSLYSLMLCTCLYSIMC